MIRKSLVVVVWVAALAGGCKAKQDGESKGGGSAISAEPKGGGGAISAEQMGTFTCTALKDDACVGPTDTFEATVPMVYVTYKTKDLPANGDHYVIRWIAEDVGQAAPPNTVIATVNEEVKDAVAGMKNYVVNSHLTKPTNGWPIGKYRIEIAHGDKPVTTARFTIK